MFIHGSIRNTLKSIVAMTTIALAGYANSAILVANLEDFTNGGGFFGQITLEDGASDTIKVTVDISDPINAGLTEGDILGIWFDVNDESILPGLASAFALPGFGGVFQLQDPAGIITAALAAANSVNQVGSNNNNLNGGGNPGPGENFDIGIALGNQGGPDFYQTISFDFVYAGLSTSLFQNERLGMRVQSIDSTSFAQGSSKLLAVAPPPPTTVPAPATFTLLCVGLLGLALSSRYRQVV